MIIRRIAEFQADFPDDQVWDGNHAAILGGHGVSAAIKEMLNRHGFEVGYLQHDPPYGWRFIARVDGTPIRLQVTDLGDHFILDTKDNSGLFARGKRSRQGHARLLKTLHEAFGGDSRFASVTWWERHEAGEHPAQEPVG